MMGRIGDVVREKSGLAYYAYSSLSAVWPGSWEVNAGLIHKTKEGNCSYHDELNLFVQEGITAEDLRTQANLIGRLPLSH